MSPSWNDPSSNESVASRPEDDFWSTSRSREVARSSDPLAHFRAVLRFRWPILAFTAIVAALAGAYILSATPLYRSTQTLLLEATDPNVVAIDELVENTAQADGYVQTQIEILGSRDIAERVIDGLDLFAEPAFVAGLARQNGLDPATLLADGVTSVERRGLAVDFMRTRLTVEAVPTTRLLHVSFLSSDATLAAEVANEVGLQYILSYVEANRELVGEVSGWLDGRLAELKDSLDRSERRLLEFKRQNGLVGVEGDVARLGEQEMLQSAAELAAARTRLMGVTDQLEQLRGESSTQGRLARLDSNALIQQIRVDIARVTQQVQRLSTQYGPRHPRRIELNSELDALQAALEQAIQQAIASLENERQLRTREVAALEARLETSRESIRDVDTKSVELVTLEREVQTDRELYYRFFDRLVETRSTQGLESANATVVEYAKPALVPAEPNRAFIVSLATLGALACAILAAIVVNVFDDSIRRVADVEERLGLPFLGAIPLSRAMRRPMCRGRLAKWLARMRRLGWGASDEKADRIFAEAFRSVRTRLLLGRRDDGCRIVLLTSSVPGEGKSMSSICLARAFAPTERVLLIDADIRRPSIARALRLDTKAPGLTHVLAGRSQPVHGIQQYAAGGSPAGEFDVLPSGPDTDHSLELLACDRFESMLAELGGRYDRILIDCAPVEAVSDALVLSRLVDAVVYVAKAHDTSLRVIASGLAKMREADAPLAGVLLTQVDIDKLATYGADYEFHGYHDYYDYAKPAHKASLSLEPEELRNLGRHQPRSERAQRPGPVRTQGPEPNKGPVPGVQRALERRRRARMSDSSSVA